jgi:hypothetical protein
MVAYLVYNVTIPIIGVTCTTVLGIFFFLYAGLHDVAFDFLTWIRESVEDQMTARVGGPEYFGWPIRGCSSSFYSDDLSFAHAQGDGLSMLQLLRGRFLRWLARCLGLWVRSSFDPPQRPRVTESQASDVKDVQVGTKNDQFQYSDYSGEVSTAPLRCSLTRRIMSDPVVSADGHSYERKEIENYLRHHCVSPLTGRQLAFTQLFPNNQLRNVIQAWTRDVEQHESSNESSGQCWKKAALDELRCPITMSMMKDAVLTCDGHRYGVIKAL